MPTHPLPEAAGLSKTLTLVFAIAGGAMVANVYYAQILVGPIGDELHLSGAAAGLIVTTMQVGYGLGLVLLVPLADLVENRRLILLLIAGTAAGLAGVALAGSAPAFLLLSFLAGVCAVAAQVIVPFAAHLAPPAQRGRVLGNVMAGVLTGILLARPVAGFVADAFGWRAVFWMSAVLMVGLLGALRLALPTRSPGTDMTYAGILSSLVHLVRSEPVLRRRTLYQGALFGVFNMFWTAVPLLLQERFGLSTRAIALFALAGAGGALAAPIAGRLADRGFSRAGTAIAMLAVVLGFLVSGWAAASGALVLLAACAIVIDAGAQGNQVLNQRVIYGLSAEARGRINAIYMSTIFACAAVGSALATITYAAGGWWATALLGAGAGAAVLGVFAMERRTGVIPSPV